MDDIRKRANDSRSDAELADECSVSANAFSAWMNGGEIKGENLEALVRVLAGKGAREQDVVQRALLAAVARRRLFNALVELTSETRAADLLRGVLGVAQVTHNQLLALGLVGESAAPILAELTFGLGDDDAVRRVLGAISAAAERSHSAFLADDISSTRSDWSLRIGLWDSLLTTAESSQLVDCEQLLSLFPSVPLFEDKTSLMQAIARIDRPTALRITANRLMSTYRFVEAQPLLREMIAIQPTDGLHHYDLAIALVRGASGSPADLEEALSECHIAARLCPTDVRPVLEAGVILHDLERYPEAERQLQAARGLDASSASAAYHLGLACDALERFEDAIRWYEEALRLEPRYVDAVSNLYGIYERRGDQKAAERYAKRAASLGDHEPMRHFEAHRRRRR